MELQTQLLDLGRSYLQITWAQLTLDLGEYKVYNLLWLGCNFFHASKNNPKCSCCHLKISGKMVQIFDLNNNKRLNFLCALIMKKIAGVIICVGLPWQFCVKN